MVLQKNFTDIENESDDCDSDKLALTPAGHIFWALAFVNISYMCSPVIYYSVSFVLVDFTDVCISSVPKNDHCT